VWPLDPLPQPPVPQRLQEMLKDYPDVIQQLQDCVNSVITDPVKAVPAFEVAMWRLEGALSGLLSQARKELGAAKTSGDLKAIEEAESKERLMSLARSSGGGMSNLSELLTYFESSKGSNELAYDRR
jgi:hypothetical protein